MSLVVTMCVPGGIVMAADSRSVQWSPHEETPSGPTSDEAHKLFVTDNHVAIGIVGVASMEGELLAPHIEAIARDGLSKMSPEEITRDLLVRLRGLRRPPDVWLTVAGYHKGLQQVFNAQVCLPEVLKPHIPPAASPLFVESGGVPESVRNKATEMPADSSVLDAFAFVHYAFRTTIEAFPTMVGGPIDILVIRPGDHFWLQRK